MSDAAMRLLIRAYLKGWCDAMIGPHFPDDIAKYVGTFMLEYHNAIVTPERVNELVEEYRSGIQS